VSAAEALAGTGIAEAETSSALDAAVPAHSRMPADAQHAAAGAAAAGIHAAFKQSYFAEEVADWLKHRATPAEAQRFER
jgi:hypothetical protein